MKTNFSDKHRNIITAFLTVGCLALVGFARAETFTVTNTAGNGDEGSLRAAIVAANAAAGFDDIVFSETLNGAVIELDASGQIVIWDDVQIGAGNLPLGITILGGANDARVISISENPVTMVYPEVSLQNLTITGGNTTGSGGGIEHGGGSLILTDVTIAGNSGSDGGGIWSQAGSLTITNSTIANNTGTFGGGGLWTEAGSVTIENSTISGNISPSGGAIYVNGTAPVTLRQATVVANPGSIAIRLANAGSDLTLDNCIVAENGDGNPDFSLESGAVVTPFGVNLIGRNDGVESIFPLDSLVGNLASPLLPLLGGLAENGGFTETMLPAANSPAIDAASGGLEADQRGVSRPQGAGFDLGAVEVVPVAAGRSDAALLKQLASAKKGLAKAKKLFKKASSPSRKAAAKKSIKKFSKKIKTLTKQLASL